MIELLRSDRIERRIRAQALRRIFWQGENPIDGLRTDVCPIVAEYYEVDMINQLKVTELCDSQKVTKLSMILPVYVGRFFLEVITTIRFLSNSSPSKSASYRENWKFI